MIRLDRWLVHTCTIERPTEVLADPFGTPEEISEILLEDIPCRFVNIAPVSRPEEKNTSLYRSVTSSDYDVYLSTNTVITERDVVSNVRDKEGRQLAIGPFDIELVIERYGRDRRGFTLLYVKRRGTP